MYTFITGIGTASPSKNNFSASLGPLPTSQSIHWARAVTPTMTAIMHHASSHAGDTLRRSDNITKEEVALAVGKISGAWKVTKLDNVEAKLKLQKFGWIERKLFLKAPAVLTYELTGDKTFSCSVVMSGVISIPATAYEVGGAASTVSAMGRIIDTWVSLSKEGDVVYVIKTYLSEKARANQSAVCIVESSAKVDPTGMYLTVTDTVYPTDGAPIKCTAHLRRPGSAKQACGSQSRRRSIPAGTLRQSLRRASCAIPMMSLLAPGSAQPY